MFGVISSAEEKSIASLPDKIHLHRYGQELFTSINFL